MGWWKVLKEQVAEFWQQLLYRIELTTAGADDLPWLDALKFFWDSLPDADKLTTAERRRLAHSVKLLVKQSVQAHYDKQVSQKQAIHLRQLLRQQAQAEQHIQQLADKRQAEMQALSDTARQQSQVLPAVTDVEEGSSDLEGLLPGGSLSIQQDDLQDHLQDLQRQQCLQYLQQWQNSSSNSRRQSAEHSRQQGAAALQMAASLSVSTSAVEVAGADHTVITIHEQLTAEIQPASDCSSSSSRSSSARRHRRSYRSAAAAAAAAADDLHQPLLAAADSSIVDREPHLHHDVLELHQQQQQQQQRGYVAPAVLQQQEQVDTFHPRQQQQEQRGYVDPAVLQQQQQADTFHSQQQQETFHLQQQQEQQDQDVVIGVRPLHNKSLVQSGSQLLLHRYLNGSQAAAAAMQAHGEAAAPAAAKVQQSNRHDSRPYSCVQQILHTAASDLSSDGLDALDVHTPTYSSGSADQCSVGPLAPLSSVSSSIAAGANSVSQAPSGVERIDSGCSTVTGDQGLGLQKGRPRVQSLWY